MCDIQLEYAELWVETKHVARTAKVCSACCGPIQSGQRYVKHFSKYDGSITSAVMCTSCEADRDQFAEAHEGMRPTPNYFPEMLDECIYEGEPLEWAAMQRRMEARAKTV